MSKHQLTQQPMVHLMLPEEKKEYLRQLNFPDEDELTMGCPEHVGTALLRALYGNGELLVLRGAVLSSLGLGEKIASILKHNPSGISELKLNDAHLGDEGIIKLLQPLSKWDAEDPHVLRSLDLSRNSLTHITAPHIENLLHATLCLRELDLSHNSIGDIGAKCIAAALRPSEEGFCTVEKLSLRRCGIGIEGGVALMQSLETNESLNSLNMSGNRFAVGKGAEALGRLLSGTSGATGMGIHSLIIGDVGLSSKDLPYFSQGLSKNTSVNDLRLPANTLGDSPELMGNFADALTTHAMLTCLNLSGCSIGDSGARCLAAMLTNHENLEVVLLGNNNISDGGAGSFGRALERNAVLRELHLNDNLIGSGGFTSVFTPLRFNNSLIVFNLAGNRLGVKGVAALSLALRHNGVLRDLDLSRCELKDEGVSELKDAGELGDPSRPLSLCDAIRANFVLSTLRVDQNSLSEKVQDALDEAMSREKKPVGHILDAMDALAKQRAEVSQANGGENQLPTTDPFVAKMTPGQKLKCPIAMGRADNIICDVMLTIETQISECRQLIHQNVAKPLTEGFFFVSLGSGIAVPLDEEDKRSALWECGRNIVCRPDDWLVL